MKKITDKHGELKLSVWKIFVMTLIVAFFAVVAKVWESNRRAEFKKSVAYNNFSEDKISKIMGDFHTLATCKDPYIENFYVKHPEFSSLHKLWVLNSSGYWKQKLEKRMCKLQNKEFIRTKAEKKHIYPTSKKMSWLDKMDYHMVDYFGNQCEVRSLDFFLWWAKQSEHKVFGAFAKRTFDWFTNYYAGFLVPADSSLGRGVEIMPYESIMELVKRAKVGQIWPCSCKSFRQSDSHIPRGTCMLIAEVASLDDSMTKYPDTGYMVADDILKKLKEFEDIGLVHQIMCVSSPQGRKMYVLCNCDNKACVPMFIKIRYNIPMVRASGFVCEQTELEKCVKCGKCATRCYFGAISFADGLPILDESKCLGCGLCVTTCPAKIRKMRRKATEPFHEYTQEQIKKHPETTIKS
ncbi:MAG: hypothetical protein EOM87_00295 [Clostridia bacterium]|nr:hypothetical protein [Clostridia bacterium]